jgi:flagellar basal body P-ring formation protein FlgA
MKKSVILILMLVMAYGRFATATASAGAVELRGSTTIEGATIRVGDLFKFDDDAVAGKIANKVVAPSPAPGKQRILNALQLASVARKHGLDWRPATRRDRTVIQRSGTLIETEEVERAIAQALGDKGMSKDGQVKLSNSGRRVYGATDRDILFTIERVRLNRRTGTFSATMNVPYGESDGNQIELTGRVVEIIKLPVLSRRVKTGDLIRIDNIDWIEYEAKRLRDTVVTDAESLIGKQAVRALMPGRPIQQRSIRSRVLVSKGSLATLTLKTNRMYLTVRVRAMGDGGLGDTIRVLNTRSKKTIEGVVAGAGRIVVPAMGLDAVARGS